MKVRFKRNKRFNCDFCGDDVNTKKGDYCKVIIVKVTGKDKFRNKFCSTQCFEKWNIVHSKELLPQETLEEGIQHEVLERDDELEEEEAPYIPPIPKDAPAKASGADYLPKTNGDHYDNHNPEDKKNLADYDPVKHAKDEMERMLSPHTYVGKDGQVRIRITPKAVYEKVRDKLKILKVVYNRDDD